LPGEAKPSGKSSASAGGLRLGFIIFSFSCRFRFRLRPGLELELGDSGPDSAESAPQTEANSQVRQSVKRPTPGMKLRPGPQSLIPNPSPRPSPEPSPSPGALGKILGLSEICSFIRKPYGKLTDFLTKILTKVSKSMFRIFNRS